MSSSEIIVANAPVSYGAFEVTIGFDPNVPDGDEILDQVAAAGYAGIDLGPVGYLGTTENLGSKLAKRNLGLAGAYLELALRRSGDAGEDPSRTRRDARHLRRDQAARSGP